MKKLEEELEFLQNVKRKEIAEKIKVARSYGDLSENSEYDDAKNEQAIIEARITTIEGDSQNRRYHRRVRELQRARSPHLRRQD